VQVVPPPKPIFRSVFHLGSHRRSSFALSSLEIAAFLLAIVQLAGCGVVYNTLPLTANPSSLTFGAVQIGKSQAATVTLQNSSMQAVTLTGMQVADSAFTLSSDQTKTSVPAGGSATIKVTFAPTAAKDYSSQVVVQSGSKQTTFSVSGTGQQPQQSTQPPASGNPAIKVSSTNLQFGSVPIGGNAQQTLTLTSTGTAPLQINTLNASGSGFSAKAPSLPLTLQPNQSLALPVTFGPKASGAASGQLHIGSNAAGASSVMVSLLGDGTTNPPAPPGSGDTPALTLSSTSVNFGSVAVGSQASESVVLTSSGTAAVVIQSLDLSDNDFATGTMKTPLTLAPGQQVTLPITYTPSGAGTATGQITLTDNASGSPNAINLTGKGTASASLSAPPSVDFGDVTVSSSETKTITLTSNGTAPLTIKSITVGGGTFSGAPLTLPQLLQPNQQMSLKVKFSPTAEGNATGSVTIASDSTTNPSVVVPMHGHGIAAETPALSASATSLSFGKVSIGSQANKTVTVTSTGTGSATITGGSVTGTGFAADDAGVPVANMAPVTLQSGQQVTFNVVFDPAKAGNAGGQLSLSTDTGSPVVVSLSGNGTNNTYPALTLSVPSLDFGNVQMGSKSVRQLTLTSSGTAPVTISSAAIAGQNFQIDSATYPAGITGWPATLTPGQQIVLSVAFAPDAVDSFSGNLALSSDAQGGAANVPLSGTGDAVPAANLTVSPTSINFGQVAVGSKASQVLTLTSSGNAPLVISAIAVSGGQFSGNVPSLPVTLQPNQQLTLSLTFEPTADGPASGMATITSNDSSGSSTVSLGGTGTTATSPQLTVSPTAVNFGNVPLNTTASKTVTLTSSGTAALTITAATPTGTGFSVSGASFPLTLNPNQSATVQVQFDPTAAGAASGQLTLTSNAGGGTTNIPLSGTGTATTSPQLTVSASSLAFGNVAVNSNATLPLTLTSSGTAPLTINSDVISGADFTASGVNFPITLNPSQSVTLIVKFAPQATGAVTGQITISSNSSTGGSTVVQLSGTGTTTAVATLQVSPTSVDFGDVNVGSTKTLNLTLTSTGTAPLTISTAKLSGTGFSDSGASFPVTLNPNQSVILQVQFDPTSAGAVNGMLTINSNSSTGATTQVQISGTGTAVPHEIDLNWDAPASSADPVAGYNIYRSSNGGGSFTKLNSSPEDQLSYVDNSVKSGTTYVYKVKSVDASGVESSASNQITLSVP
jgi:hypothetical protein